MQFRSRDWFINIGLFVGSMVIFFGGIEIALRVTGIEKGHPVAPGIYRNNPNPDIGYDLLPNLRKKAFRSTVTTNNLGFRSPELDPKKPTIAVLGDSIAFGYGLQDNETIAAQLDGLLGHRFNVLNTAAPGYNLKQEMGIYDTRVKNLHPSALILIFHFNDLQDMEPGFMDSEGNLRPVGWKPTASRCAPIETGLLGLIPGRCWLDQHSAFYRTVKKFVISRTEQKNLKQQVAEYKETAFSDHVTDDRINLYHAELRHLVSMLPKDMPKLFVLWPEKQLHFISRPKVKAVVESEGFHVLDMYEVFGNDAPTLGWDTVHPNAETAKQAASVIKGAMEYWKIVP